VICSAVNARCQSNMNSSNWSLCSCRWKIFHVLFPYPTFHILLWNVDSNLEKCVLQGLCGMWEEWSLRCICLFVFLSFESRCKHFQVFSLWNRFNWENTTRCLVPTITVNTENYWSIKTCCQRILWTCICYVTNSIAFVQFIHTPSLTLYLLDPMGSKWHDVVKATNNYRYDKNGHLSLFGVDMQKYGASGM